MTATLLTVVGTRPNFVKVAPVLHAAARLGSLRCLVLHTGQHYDRELSDVFFEQLGMTRPDHHLETGSGTHGEQTAAVVVGVERVLLAERPDAVLVAGDVNSTMAAALAAVKLGIPVIHLEAGLRSHDWTMPEEVNRVVTDRVADLLLAPSADAVDNLRAEAIPHDRISLVGNTMIDSLLSLLETARATGTRDRMGLSDGGYVLVTLHRPSLVDQTVPLLQTLDVLAEIGRRTPVVLPVHPRTQARLDAAGYKPPAGLRLLEPLGYLEFIDLQAAAQLVVTDSGGIQEEASVLGVPCLTYRETTERPITVHLGTNRVIGTSPDALHRSCLEILSNGQPRRGSQIPLWDGNAGARSAEAIATFLTRL